MTATNQRPDDHHSVERPQPLLTIFTVLKPFVGESDLHQRNAIASWEALSPEVQVLLFSDSEIPSDLRQRLPCFETKKCNSFGTPLLSEIFRTAADQGRGRARAYLNADILLDARFVEAVSRLLDSDLERWLAIGRRTEFGVPDDSDGEQENRIAEYFREMDQRGKKASIVCKDYFVFSPNLFRQIPPFAVGRGNWDSWMVQQAKADGVPVIDISHVAPVIHQEHGYSHIRGGRMAAYVSGCEARENQRLAGGRHLVRGSTPDWRMDQQGIRQIDFPALEFVRDLVCLGSLVQNIIGPRVRISLFRRESVRSGTQ